LSLTNFKISISNQLSKGIYLRHIEINDDKNGEAKGRSLTINLAEVDIRIYVFEALVNNNFYAIGKSSSPRLPNYGLSIPNLIDSKKRNRLDIPDDELKRCLFACNTIHTNFVRGNGFVIVDGKLVHKPVGAIALDGEEYVPLDGLYSCMILSPGRPIVKNLIIKKNILQEENTKNLAISGPKIVSKGKNIVERIPVRKKENGQTIGNEINYSPYDDRTSFTAFGITDDGTLIAVSMFACISVQKGDLVKFKAEKNKGITLNEMANLLIELGAVEGIAGGGSGDTQQYIKDRGIWVSTPRLQAKRGQVEGFRRLGAILCILSKTK
jgi:hypothetical protein